MYKNELKAKDALNLYFDQYHFKDGGYNKKWFTIKIGFIYIPFPNIKSRVEAVKIHDLHHLITEYKANLKGEVEIGGWEIGSGCGRYYVAWLLNIGSFYYGMFFYPKSLFNAFLKGCRCKTNLYYNTVYDDVLLQKTVGELRNFTGYISTSSNNRRHYIYFFTLSFVLLVITIALLIAAWKLC